MTVRDRTALGLAALAALQLLHLLDDLRTDPEANLLRPQPVLGIGGTLVALFLIRRGAPAGRVLALVAAGLVTWGFLLSHGIPVEVGPSKPYWGDGSADALQWLGVTLIWACCAFVWVNARRLARVAAV